MATQKALLRVDEARRRFVFRGIGDGLRPSADEHPATGGAALLVLAHGTAEGRSGLIQLDPARWRARSKKGLSYVYRDRKGTHGGVRKVVFAPGSLTVKAAGKQFPWAGEAAPDLVEVLFRIGQEWHCADVAGEMTRKGFRARDAFAPLACAPLVCGNGVRELGEPCDDGDLDDGDACTTLCQLGECDAPTYDSTWAAIQDLVFAKHGCTTGPCHGSTPGQGDLDLSPAAAYRELLDVPSTGSAFARVLPGGPKRSSLYLKLAAAVSPGSVEIGGTPMPSGLPPIGEDALEALRLWIIGGAPEHGVVEGAQGLLDACLPEPTPVVIEPLDPPAPGTGVQFRMPEFPLPANSETEVCFASYYDFSAQVPADLKDPTGEYMYVNGSELRQDPHSHHLQIIYSGAPATILDHPAFGAWTCKGGAQAGVPCEPTDLDACGDGLCGSTPVTNIACIGYGPPGYQVGIVTHTIGGAQTAQNYDPGLPGLFRKVPIKGVLYWNSHAFNLTAEDTRMHAYDNQLFATDRRFESRGITTVETTFMPAGSPPFARTTVCADHVLPQDARLLFLTSHTHKRGEHFWATHPDGTRIFENFEYADPAVAGYDPPLVFDSPVAAERTIHFCATYHNGVAADGAPDVTTVRRRSVTPSNGSPCGAVACVAGRVGAPCATDAACDSSPGAGDGWCDACALTGGVTTEDSMFILIGAYVDGPLE
jgi:cysteine-rich repeat protein